MTESVDTHNKLDMTRQQFMITAVVSEFGILLLALILGWLLDIRFWNALAFDARSIALGIFLGLPLVAVAIFCAESKLRIFEQIRKDLDMVIELFGRCSIGDILIVSVLAGVGEEALFRGVLQPLLANYLGIYGSIAIVGIVFGLVHAISRQYIVFAATIGVFLGAVYWWSGNLLVPILVHAVYDFVALVYGVYFRRRELA